MTPEQQNKLDEELIDFARAGNLEKATAAVSLGADIHALGDKPLRVAASAGRESVVTFLLKNGADANAEEGEALIRAATFGHAGVVRLLLSNKADPHFSDDQALRMASFEGKADVVRVLLQFKADPFAMRGSARALADNEKHAGVVEALAEAMNAQRQAFFFDLALQEKTQGWLRAPYADTGESAFIRAVKMNALDAVAQKMKQSGDRLTFADVHETKDRTGRSLAVLAAEQGKLKILFDAEFWRGNLGDLQATWDKLRPQTQKQSGVTAEDFQSLVAWHRQNALKSGAGRFKLKP